MKSKTILISPIETSVTILNNAQELLHLTSSNINSSNAIIKTQRMLFIPVDDSNDQVHNVRVSMEDKTEPKTNNFTENMKKLENVSENKETIKPYNDISIQHNFLKLSRPLSRSFQDFNVLKSAHDDSIKMYRSFSESKIKVLKVIKNDFPPNKIIGKIDTGAIPKHTTKIKTDEILKSSFVREKLDLIDDGSKYLSQRAKKIKKAKEAFFLNSAEPPILTEENDNDIEIEPFPENLSIASNISGSTNSSKNPRFGFTSITSSIRKVINKNNKASTTKMNSITELCKQTLYLDITGSTQKKKSNFLNI